MLWVGSFHYSIDSYKIFLHTHCFGYPKLIFPLKTSFSIILFCFLDTNVWWNQSYYAMNVPLTLIIFFAKATTLFLNAFPSYQTHRHWSLTCSKLCIVVHRKELVKLSFPLLQFTFNKKKTKSYKKVKFVYLRMSITVKAKALSCWIFEKVPNENCTPLTEKKTKSRRQNKLENPAKKERGKGK